MNLVHCMWYFCCARPQDKALLGSNLSGGLGDRAERTGLHRRLCPSFHFVELPCRRFQGFCEIEPKSISFSRDEQTQAAPREILYKHVLVIVPSRRHADQANTRVSEKAIDERIAPTTLPLAMRAIIQFDARDNPRRSGTTDDKVDVLLGNSVCIPPFPIAVGASDNIGEPDLARNAIAMCDDGREDLEKRGLIPGQQETSRRECPTCCRPAANTPAPALAKTIVHDDHFQSSLDMAMRSNTVAKSG